MAGFLAVGATGVPLRVRLTPRGGSDRIKGTVTDAGGGTLLAIRAAAPPVGGEANAALPECLAKALGVPRSALTLAAGASSRIKTVEATGDPAALAERAAALAAGD